MNWRDKIKELIKNNDQLLIKEQPGSIRIDDKEQSSCYLTCCYTRDGENLISAHFCRLIKNENGVLLSGDIEAVFNTKYPDSVKFIQNESEYKEAKIKLDANNLRAFESFVSIPLYCGWTEKISLVDKYRFKIKISYFNQDKKARQKTIFLLPEVMLSLPIITDYIIFPFVYIYLNIKYLFNPQSNTIRVEPLISNNR